MKITKSLNTLACLLAAWLLPCEPGSTAEDKPTAPAAVAKTFKDAAVEDFDKLRAGTNAVLLDVRTPREFDAGHIPGATNIDWYAPDFAEKAAKLDKSKTYLVNCASGRRSALACDKMVSRLGLTNCVNLKGGFSAWQKAGKPVAK
jgi:rhodanese-related sulfurtransferase